ncbi:MAG: hypothetical protein VKK04_21765 [Synechococcales bacterium]|nr:hypothetical protein [Synechococcales bacterium]
MSSEPPNSPEYDPSVAPPTDGEGGDRPDAPAPDGSPVSAANEPILASSEVAPVSRTTQNVVQNLWNKVQPPLTAITVAGLRASLRGVDWAIGRLEPAAPSQPSGDATMPNVSQPSASQGIWSQVQPRLVSGGLLILIVLGQGLGGLLKQLDDSATLPPALMAAAAGNPAWNRISSILQQLWQRWTGVLAFLRDRLPALRQLSNTAMTTILLGTLVLLFWITSSLGSAPAAETSGEQPLQLAEGDAPTTIVSSDDLETTEPAALTPEQKLIVSLQEQVSELSAQYAEGLVQSVQANFLSDRLTVKVEPAWYDLAPQRQRQLAREMLERAQSLDFQSLEILDVGGDRIARSPVVGSDMVFFK